MMDQLTDISRKLDNVRNLLTNGNLPIENEIELRRASISFGQKLYQITGNTARLQDSIQHAQAIVRLLPTPSAQRAHNLDQLAFLEMSAFEVTNSAKTLNDSIAHSKQARDEALAANDPQLWHIYHNLGYSLSHRALMTKNDQDIDEAITCGRKVLHLTDHARSEYYSLKINLINRLQTRYSVHHRSADVDEATSLLDETLQSSRSSPDQHGAALIMKAKILFDRYSETKDLQDLDDAIANGQQGILSVSSGHEFRSKIPPLLADMHKTRYKHNGDLTSLNAALDGYKQTLHVTPQNFQNRLLYISIYLDLLRESVYASSDLPHVQGAIRDARSLREEVPIEHMKRYHCSISLLAMLSKQYLLTRQLTNLNEVVGLLNSIVHEYNSTLDISKPKVPTDPLQTLGLYFWRIDKAALDGPKRAQVLEQIYLFYRPVHESKNIHEGMLVMLKDHELELEALAQSLDEGDTLSNTPSRAEAPASKGKEIEKLSQSEHATKSRPNADGNDYIDPIFGHRFLAMDPKDDRITLSMRGIISSILGYGDDYVSPASWPEFEAQEAQLERQSFKKDKQEGKDPNPNLCRMCRSTKPLVPSEAAGFTWNNKQGIPFGNYGQLLTRKHCSICRLILSLITVEGTDQLHPRLAQIDSEVQGTQFHIQSLPSGEKMLGVEYGMTAVGALRVLTPANLSDALRQKPPTEKSTNFFENTSELLSFVNENEQRMNFTQIRQWAYDCQKNHGDLCNDLSHSPRYHADIPLYLIDVTDDCLVYDTSAQRYLTLSYVWGQSYVPKTSKANVKQRCKRQSFNQIQLPNTIKDAIALVHGLGERYLWTDALCLVQDDLAQMKQDIPRMDIIYKKAFANIVALAGKDADAGITGITSKSRPPQTVEILPLLRGSADLAFSKDTNAVHENVCIVATPKPLVFAQESSMWNTRGWILQEQLLASRNIYFSQDNVYFQCNEALQCETTLEGKFESFWDEYDTEGPRKAVSINPLADLKRMGNLSTEDRTLQVFKAYSELVELYTIRNLTFQGDILNAFSGMLSTVSQEFKSMGVSGFNASGLPVAALHFALLWTPVGSLAVRQAMGASGSPSPASPTEDRQDEYQLDFPTWSWAGWIGSVDYRLSPPEKEPLAGTLISRCYVMQRGQPTRVLVGSAQPAAYQKETPKLGALFANMKISTPSLPNRQILLMNVPLVYGCKFSVDRDRTPDYVSKSKHIHSSTTQPIVRLLDSKRRHCGILFEHLDYHKITAQYSGERSQGFEYLQSFADKGIIGISQTTDAFDRRRGFLRVEGDIRLFDSEEFPAQGVGSALVNVLVLRPSMQTFFERIAVGQIHIKAWEEAGPVASWVQLG